jgi:hypothetical protein
MESPEPPAAQARPGPVPTDSESVAEPASTSEPRRLPVAARYPTRFSGPAAGPDRRRMERFRPVEEIHEDAAHR